MNVHRNFSGSCSISGSLVIRSGGGASGTYLSDMKRCFFFGIYIQESLRNQRNYQSSRTRNLKIPSPARKSILAKEKSLSLPNLLDMWIIMNQWMWDRIQISYNLHIIVQLGSQRVRMVAHAWTSPNVAEDDDGSRVAAIFTITQLNA